MNKKVKSVLSKIAYPFAKRFIAGKTAEDALKTAKELNEQGLEAIINYLGEDVKTQKQAGETTNVYLYLLVEIRERNLQARISVKPSQLGLQINPPCYYGNLFKIGKAACAFDIPLEIDMEHFKDVEATIQNTIALKKAFPDLNIRQAIQTRLWRSTVDIDDLTATRVKIRLCKGAYKDEKSELVPEKIAGNRIIYHSEELIKQKMNPAIATHDSKLLNKYLKEFPNDTEAEIQLLLGIKKRLAKKLGEAHLRCPLYINAIYVPFGTNWLPYGLRRFKYVAKKLPPIIWDEIMMLFEK